MRGNTAAAIAFLALLVGPLSAEHVRQYTLPVKGSSPSATVFLGRSIFVSTESGIYKLDLDQPSPQFVRIYDAYVTDLVVGPDGALWAPKSIAGADDTLLRLDPEDHSVRALRILPGGSNWGLAVGTDGLFWIVVSVGQPREHRLVRVTTSGEIVSSVPVPDGVYYSVNSQQHRVTTEGLWWVEPVFGGLKLLTATGQLQSFAIPFSPAWLASGGDFLWVVGTTHVAKVGLNGTVLAVYTAATRINGAAADAEGDLWLREAGGLTGITAEGVYDARETLPPSRCPADLMDRSIVAFSETGEIAVTDPVRAFRFEEPNFCGVPGAFDTVTVLQPSHDGAHDIPAAGPTALLMLAIALAIAGAVVATKTG